MTEYHIFKNIEKHIHLNDTEKVRFIEALSVLKIKKKDHILRQGVLCKKLFFVESGSLRAYHLNAEGKEATVMFAVKDWWVTDMNGFSNQRPAFLSIEALEPCTILALEYQVMETLYSEIPKIERYFRILFQNAYIREQQRALQTISSNTYERYIQFVANYPLIVEKVNQKQIASYLGVTPEFLSSIKKQ